MKVPISKGLISTEKEKLFYSLRSRKLMFTDKINLFLLECKSRKFAFQDNKMFEHIHDNMPVFASKSHQIIINISTFL